METRKEIVGRQRKRYAKASKQEKGRILDSVCQTVGLSRDRAARLLRRETEGAERKGKRPGRKRKYHEEAVIKLLEKLWAQMDFICGKRLCAGLPRMVEALKRHGELNAPEWAINAVLEMSAATADRLLKDARRKSELRGRSTTKPGTLRKNDIPIRLGTEWEDNKPGYMEMDLVAHCGETTAGDYVNTLDMTDIYSGWTETVAVVNKAQMHVFAGIKAIRGRLPFTLLGVDSDNGSEFINSHLYRYCKNEELVFTRSRPYRKNDNCHVEQKNYSVVRKQIGYTRLEGWEAVKMLNTYYELLRLYSNYFLPSAKLLSKERRGSRVHKKYDIPITPCERLLISPDVTDAQKAGLETQFMTLNPAALKCDMIALQEQIEALALSHARPGSPR